MENLEIKMKNLKNYKGHYTITENGQIFSIRSNKFIKPFLTEDGYHRIELSKNGVGKKHRVHILLLESFSPNPDPDKYDQVNHWDGNKTNNVLENLKWSNDEENRDHAINVLGYTHCSPVKIKRIDILTKEEVIFKTKHSAAKSLVLPDERTSQKLKNRSKEIRRALNSETHKYLNFLWYQID